MEYVDPAFVWIHQHHFHLNINKRGYLRSAREKARMCLAPLTHDGEGFLQSLEAGKVWALRGTRGSSSPRTEHAA
jgi:hypothetical protein